MDNETKKNDIIINLDHLEQTSAHQPHELIYNEECEQWAEQIRSHLDSNTPAPSAEREATNTLFKQPTYYIGGGRGSGKSTFLRALIQRLITQNSQTQSTTRIKHLTTVDPTTLGAGENFFIYILSIFFENIKDHFDTIPPWNQQNKEQLSKRKHLNALLEELTISVKSLTNSKTSHLDTIDDSWVYQDSMKLGMSSKNLRKKFQDLVAQTCDLFECSALVIGIDDADINCSKSADVLEYLRKYMVTPRLIFVFAGDLNLQEQVVRGMQLEHFNKDTFKLDAANNAIRLRLIDQMQEQYMLKLFPIANRYTLQNLEREKLRHICLSLNDGTTKKQCLPFLQGIIETHIGSGASYMSAIINMPKRSFFQLLKYWLTHENESEAVVKGLQQMATYAIAKYGIRASEIEQGSVSALSQAIISVVSKDEDKIAAASLIPVRDDEMNRAFLYLSSEITRTAVHLHKGLEFLLTSYSYFQAHNRFREESNGHESQLLEESFRRYMDTTFSGNYNFWGRRMTAIMAQISKNGLATKAKQYKNGCIRIMQRSSDSGWKRLDGVEKDMIALHHKERMSRPDTRDMLRYYLAFKKSLSGVSYNNVSAICVSVFNILGCLQQCISILLSDKNREESLLKEITPSSQCAEENSPFSTKEIIAEDENDGSANVKDNVNVLPAKLDRDDMKQIVKEIIEWWDSRPCRPDATPHFAPHFSNCWKHFTGSLSWRTESILLTVPPYNEDSTLKSNSGEPYHYVAETLDCFMKSFTEALRLHIGEDYEQFVASFPLWEPLSPRQNGGRYQKARDLLNKVYAGQVAAKVKSATGSGITGSFRKTKDTAADSTTDPVMTEEETKGSSETTTPEPPATDAQPPANLPQPSVVKAQPKAGKKNSARKKKEA